jgi:UDP-N-acetylenolpyruvoylglucosamine reductase
VGDRRRRPSLIVADDGFRGLVLRYRADRLAANGAYVTAGAGAGLQDLVDFANARGLKGLETLAGIPGWVGAAVYGNAGAYGHSISERVVGEDFFDGERVRSFDNGRASSRTGRAFSSATRSGSSSRPIWRSRQTMPRRWRRLPPIS